MLKLFPRPRREKVGKKQGAGKKNKSTARGRRETGTKEQMDHSFQSTMSALAQEKLFFSSGRPHVRHRRGEKGTPSLAESSDFKGGHALAEISFIFKGPSYGTRPTKPHPIPSYPRPPPGFSRRLALILKKMVDKDEVARGPFSTERCMENRRRGPVRRKSRDILANYSPAFLWPFRTEFSL